MHLFLKLVDGEVIEQTINANVCIIGRSQKCDIVVPNDGMSRQHCQIEIINGEYFVTDMGSTNGVLIDGQRIETNKKVPYQTFLTLSFGAVQTVQITEDAPPSPYAISSSMPKTQSTSEREDLTMTRTISMKEMAATKKAVHSNQGSHSNIHKARHQLNKKDAGAQAWVMNLLAILILAGTAYWYLSKEDVVIEEVQVVEEIQAEPAPARSTDQN